VNTGSGTPVNQQSEACTTRALVAQEPPWEHESSTHTTREAKEYEATRGGDEKSETLVVPQKAGNSPHEDPRREGASNGETRARER